MALWKLNLLDANSLLADSPADGGREQHLDRKTAGLLAFLALQGPASRRQLAGLLWPDSAEARARNSLAQVVSRLRRGTYQEVVGGDEILRLDQALRSDVEQFLDLTRRRDHTRATELAGELLPHYEYDDLPAFDEWLSSERAAIDAATASALSGRIKQLEDEGRVQEAVGLALRLVNLDPLQEGSWRLLMQLHHRNDDRAGALRVLAECRAVLKRELGVEPSAETIAAAEGKAVGQEAGGQAARATGLVGREAELAAMETAWRRGHAIMVLGPAGSGKTRLLEEFARDKAPVLRTGGMPGDADVPYASLARAFRRLTRARPDLRLEPWVSAELARLLPELGTSAEPRDDLRFETALAQLYDTFLAGDGIVLADDLQHYDPASFEAAGRIVNRRPYEGLPARTVVACRPAELPAAYLGLSSALSRQGALTVVALGGLDEAATTELAVQVGGEGVRHLGARLHAFTGGNPLFIIETTELLVESGAEPSAPLDCLPAGPRSVGTIHEALSLLPHEALRLLQAASVLETPGDLEVLADVLQRSAVDLWTPWRRLENEGYLVGGRLASGLLAVAVEATVPEVVRRSLVRSRRE